MVVYSFYIFDRHGEHNTPAIVDCPLTQRSGVHLLEAPLFSQRRDIWQIRERCG